MVGSRLNETVNQKTSVMKKQLKYSSLLLMAFALILIGCEKETEGVSKVTKFAEFEIIGDNPYFIDVNNPPTNYQDPGVIATEGGEEIDVTIDHNIDLNNAGFYTVTYSAENSDGFEATTTRTVVVGCPGDLSKTLTATGQASSSVVGDFDVTITRQDNGKFKFNEITGVFNVAIEGTIGILCDQVVTGSSSFGMYDDAVLDLNNNELVITWSYAPLGFSGETTTIPITYN